MKTDVASTAVQYGRVTIHTEGGAEIPISHADALVLVDFCYKHELRVLKTRKDFNAAVTTSVIEFPDSKPNFQSISVSDVDVAIHNATEKIADMELFRFHNMLRDLLETHIITDCKKYDVTGMVSQEDGSSIRFYGSNGGSLILTEEDAFLIIHVAKINSQKVGLYSVSSSEDAQRPMYLHVLRNSFAVINRAREYLIFDKETFGYMLDDEWKDPLAAGGETVKKFKAMRKCGSCGDIKNGQ